MKKYFKNLLVFGAAFLIFCFLFFLKIASAQDLNCQDSDLGKSYFSTGEIKMGNSSVWRDTCFNSTQVQEGYCDSKVGAGYSAIVFSCPNGCQSGACRPLINLLSFSNGGTVKEGENFVIRWEFEGLPGNKEIQVSIIRSDGLRGDIANVPVSSNSFSWKVETDLKNWYYPASAVEPVSPKIVFDKNNNFSFQYKILITDEESKAGTQSNAFFNVIKRPGFNLAQGSKLGTDDSAGFQLNICNDGNKDFDSFGQAIKAEITAGLSGQETKVSKTMPVFSGILKIGKCAESLVIPYYDFQMDQKKEYEIKISLNTAGEFVELLDNDNIKTYYLTPQPGIKVISPVAGERWGINGRHRISLQVSGPEIWTKVQMTANDKATGKEYPIDALHASPPQLDYWWTIPADLPAGEQYVIKITSDDPDFKIKESVEFAIIEPKFSCTDSDNGSDYYTKGTIEGVFEALKDATESRSADDFCLDENTLIEYFCKDDYILSERFNCSFGCSEGVCKKSINDTPMASVPKLLDSTPASTFSATPTPTPAPIVKATPKTAPSNTRIIAKASPTPLATPLFLREAPNLDNFKNQMAVISSGFSKFFDVLKKLSGK